MKNDHSKNDQHRSPRHKGEAERPSKGKHFVLFAAFLMIASTAVFVTMNDDDTSFAGIMVPEPTPYSTVTIIETPGGSVYPSGIQAVNLGDDLTITVISGPGYEIDDVKLDGVSVKGDLVGDTYTIRNINKNMIFEVSFKETDGGDPEPIPPLEVMIIAGDNGTTDPDVTQSVEEGDDLAVTLTPNSGYEIDDVKLDGVSVKGDVVNGVYTIKNVSKSMTLEVTFKVSSSDGGDNTMLYVAAGVAVAAVALIGAVFLLRRP